ncbi:MAG: DUF192 domain-containing protein [Spirochaetaceae bacterium]|nr:DUF192 domain-containing protein [Spirochaetaceae bacterium]
MKYLSFHAFIINFTVVFTACVPAEQMAQPKLTSTTLVIVNQAGKDVTVDAELAVSAEEQRRGLMWRKNLDDGCGMLFVYQRDQILSFWMKNTIIPLSIAFISRDGRIIEIHDMRPQSLQAVRSSRSVRYALEAPQGWFERAGISAGCTVRLPGRL